MKRIVLWVAPPALVLAVVLGLYFGVLGRESSVKSHVHSTPPAVQINQYRAVTTTAEGHSTPPVKVTTSK